MATWWRPIMDKCVHEIASVARAHAREAITEQARGIPAALCNTIDREWTCECNKYISKLKEVLDNGLQKEIPWGTMNHYFTSKYKAEEALPEELIQDLFDSNSEGLYDRLEPCMASHNEFGKRLREELIDAKERWSTKFAEKTLYEQQQQRFFWAVRATWAVEHKTFTDYILKETTQNLLEPRNRWSASLFSNEKIKAAAVEDPSTKQERQALKEYLDRMNQCMDEVRNLQSDGASQ